MTAARPAARPAGTYIHRPTRVRAMTWTGDLAHLPDTCLYFGRALEPVDIPGLGLCIPLATRCGTVYATPGDVLVLSSTGELTPVHDHEFATDYQLTKEPTV